MNDCSLYDGLLVITKSVCDIDEGLMKTRLGAGASGVIGPIGVSAR